MSGPHCRFSCIIIIIIILIIIIIINAARSEEMQVRSGWTRTEVERDWVSIGWLCYGIRLIPSRSALVRGLSPAPGWYGLSLREKHLCVQCSGWGGTLSGEAEPLPPRQPSR